MVPFSQKMMVYKLLCKYEWVGSSKIITHRYKIPTKQRQPFSEDVLAYDISQTVEVLHIL